jgi:aminoglycoside phosphotransferase family enzyme/predicted kinase
VLFFLGDLVLKAKKPVDLGFLDFSTRPKRLQACRREVALNRELSPDVYLGVWDVTDEYGRPRDHLVVMRRMPDDLRLATLVRAGRDVSDEVAQIAHVVAAFHGRCARSERIAQGGSRRALADRWEATFAQVVPFTGPVLDPDVVDRVELLTRRYLAGRDALFEDRRRRDAVVAGHGDLMAEDIFCLRDGPRILDCIDFDDALRHLDRLDDAAFLVMDLERLGSPTAATLFRERYLELSGDAAPESLFEHYIAYRAFMRAKVACLRNAQGDPSSADEARRLSRLALHHLTRARVRLVLVGGPPGTGKTTLATALADRLGMVVLSSDRVRKELAGVPTEASLRAPYLDGAYSSESTGRTYRELLSRAERLLAMGESVILDATWADAGRRAAARAVAERTSSDLVQLECRTAPGLVARRLATRTSMSDADEVVAAQMRTSFADWPEAVGIDTTADPHACLAEAVRHVEGDVPAPPRRPRMAPD